MQLETLRLLLTPLLEQDYLNYTTLLEEAAIRAFNPYLLQQQNQLQFLNWLKKLQRKSHKQQSITLALRLKSAQHLIGFISLNKINHYHGSAELGFWLGLPYWKQGYMSEAITRLSEYAFSNLKLQRIEALVLQENHASACTLKRCHFELEGVFQNKIRFQENWHNIAGYALLAK